ncbi:hypothetical protein ACOTHA_29265 [Achromobacter xylosoxidans]
MTAQVSGQSSSVELSTIYFFKHTLPASIPLHECGLPLAEAIPNSISAYYGYQARLEGIVAAREYAQRNGLKFTAVDFSVALEERPNLRQMTAQDLERFDFLSFHKLSRSMMDDVVIVMKKGLQARGISTEDIDFKRPQNVLARHPALIDDLQAQAAWQHVKIIAHPAQLAFSDRTYNVATVPYRHWGQITEAFCRIDPLHISLERPAPAARPDAPGLVRDRGYKPDTSSKPPNR